jgi:2,3-bisphosphoglycerate-dependent phosphoglycerate mutase
MMNEKIEIVFMRHGRSRADDEEVHEGRYDAPLTNLGRAQAERRAAELRETGIGFDAIIASPLKRARETAQIVSDVLDIGVELDKDWMEKDNGPLAGLPYHVAGASYPIPAFHNPFQPHVVSADAGESTWSFHSRAARALERVIRRGVGSYLVVAHGGILNAAMGCIVGAQPTVSGQGVTFSFGDTGYLRTAYNPNRHHWIVRELVRG